MNQQDMITRELDLARDYRREAKRRKKNPAFVAQLEKWAQDHEARGELMRSGPLFGVGAEG